jgi:hypothetical protein
MAEWHEFYALVGAMAGVLIGLIFVVISLGADHAVKGDEHRVRVFVTPCSCISRHCFFCRWLCSPRFPILSAQSRLA